MECIEHNGFTVAEVRITYVAPESNHCLVVSVTYSPYFATVLWARLVLVQDPLRQFETYINVENQPKIAFLAKN